MKNNVFVKNSLWLAGLLLMLGASMAAYGFSAAGTRTDCPGKVTCPLTGKEICQDQCPLVDAKQSDCPGTIECPLTGELICRDECPVGTEQQTAVADKQLPPCCRGKQ